jgi:uncharacterized cupin superfamily protein
MAYVIVDPDVLVPGRGPHPAGSPYDKRIGEALGVTAFEVYQVELPPGAETVKHDHLRDNNEDVYVVLHGGGWLVVDDEAVPVSPGDYVAVTTESSRLMRARDQGVVFVALCAEA